MQMTDRESVDFYNQVRTKRRQIMEQRSSVMSGSADEEFDWTKYDPPEALNKLPTITSEIIIAVVQSSLENIRNQVQAEKTRAEEQRSAILEEAEAEAAEAAAEAEADQGKGKDRTSPDDAVHSHDVNPTERPAALPTPRNSDDFVGPLLRPHKRSRFGGISRILRHVRGHSESSKSERSRSVPLHIRFANPDPDQPPTQFTQFVYKRLVGGPSPDPATVAEQEQVECVSCLDDLPKKDAIKAVCHHYCADCFARLIRTAVDTEAQWPPKCCLNPVPFRTIAKYASADLLAAYRLKAEEFRVPIERRLYCPRPDCGAWVREEARDGAARTATCPSGHEMCTMCRGPAHRGAGAGADAEPCPQDKETLLADQLAEEEGWRRCGRCGVLVEHTEACRHMTCRCGAEFCYVCGGAGWQTCGCTDAQLGAIKERAAERRRARTAEEEAEARELAEALRLVEEFERRERRREEARREEERRVAEERRRREAEERARREEARRRELDGKYAELRGTLAKLEGLQRTVLEYGHDRELEGLTARAAEERATVTAEQERERNDLRDAAAARVREREAAFDREFADRVAWERVLEERYERVLALFWSDKIGGLPRARDAARAFRRANDEHMDEWLAYRDREMERTRYLLGDEVAIREELMETTRRRLEERLGSEQAELGRKQRAEGRWFELVTEERKRLLAEVEAVERENGGEDVGQASGSGVALGVEEGWASENEVDVSVLSIYS